jgi:type I restriction enzyme S subunit
MNWADQPYAIGRGLAAIRPKDGVSHRHFVRAVVERGLPALLGQATGSTFPSVSGEQIRSSPCPSLPRSDRLVISQVLGALDDKIDLNRRMCQTLEAMARALFTSWFVDFDPVRAKMEGRDPGLPKEIADLFPSRLVDSELGPIPEGWRVASLRDEFEAAKGLSYKGSGLSDSGVPLHNLNSIFEGGGYKHSGIKWYRGEYADRHLIKGGDVIVANTEQGHDRLLIGFAARVPNDYDGLGLFSHHLYRLRTALGAQLTGNWIYRLLNTRAMHETVSGYANGTTVNMLPIDGLQSPRFVVPAGEIVATFDRQDEDWQARGALAMRETRTLAALRDTLLPKLISGELRVPASLGSMQEVAT